MGVTKKGTPASQVQTHHASHVLNFPTRHACPAIKLLQSHLLRHFPFPDSVNQSRTHRFAVCVMYLVQRLT